jgi:tetratricopeptide (TPR) repeat protein/ADP-heptose:LPS heptosyltransferase
MYMPTFKDDFLSRAIELHKTGNVAAAIREYEKFLRINPRHPGALNLLGLAYFQQDEPTKAIVFIEQALELRPGLPGANYNLGTMLQRLKRHQEALSQFEKALVLDPQDADAHNNIGSIFNSLGREAEAVSHFEKAVALRPHYGAAHFNLAKLLSAHKEHEKAVTHYRAALHHTQGLYEAHFGLATALQALNRFDEAIGICKQAVALAPENPEAHFRLANAYYGLNLYSAACESFARAIALGLPAEFAAKAGHYYAISLQILGRYEEAQREFDKIIAMHGEEPDCQAAKTSKSLMYLGLGRFSEGWPLYEHRSSSTDSSLRHEQPRWNGEAMVGPLWVWPEQGLGDQILHASMINDLRARVPEIVLEVEPRLVDLFARSFPRVRVLALGSDQSNEKIKAQIPIASLGRYFRLDWGAFPKRPQPYLFCDPRRAAALRERLVVGDKKIVGLSWRSASPEKGHRKTAQLLDFINVFRLTNVQCIDLQYGSTESERAEVERATGTAIVHLDDIDNTNDIDGLAALICACDAVVTVSNTTAHLAGALGIPTWVFVPYGIAQMWYWFRGENESPWYPRVQVRHQNEGQSWENLVSLNSTAIADFLSLKK